MTTATITPDSRADLLGHVAAHRRARDVAEVEILQAAADWAAWHGEDSLVGPAAEWDHLLPMGGEGTPEVSEFCIAEFAAVAGLTTDAGRSYVGDAVEIQHRLPRLWTRVLRIEVQVWRARRIAQATRFLPPDAAAWVDRQVTPTAHNIGPVVLDRLIEKAKVRFDPDRARAERDAAEEKRHVTIHPDRVSHYGTVDVDATLDLADAGDLETAIARRAAWLAEHGNTATLEIRRALALGEMARADLARDLATGAPTSQSGGAGVDLRVHLTAADLARLAADTAAAASGKQQARDSARTKPSTDPDRAGASEGAPASEPISLARIERTRSFILAEQLREWLQRPGLKITLRPVIDTAATLRTDRYEIPDPFRALVEERDGTCRFPHCRRPATRSDLDHITPYRHRPPDDAGPPDDTGPPNDTGQTCTDDLAPLCRRHHRHKTHARWTYQALEPGIYQWRSPHNHHFLVTPLGTTEL